MCLCPSLASQPVEKVRRPVRQARVRARKSSCLQRSSLLSPCAFARRPRPPSALAISPPFVACAGGSFARLRAQTHPLVGPPCRPYGRQGSGFDSPWRDGNGAAWSRRRWSEKLVVLSPPASCVGEQPPRPRATHIAPPSCPPRIPRWSMIPPRSPILLPFPISLCCFLAGAAPFRQSSSGGARRCVATQAPAPSCHPQWASRI